MNIAVFCSGNDVPEQYQSAARELAKRIAEGKHTLVWGGADEGTMHVMGDTVHRLGARVVGVIREPIKAKAYKEADEMIVVPNEYEMNLGIIDRGDAIVALPGGVGTLNEITMVLRLRKNNAHRKPLVILNTGSFFAGLQDQIVRMQEEGFLRDGITDGVVFVGTPEDAMRYIDEHNA